MLYRLLRNNRESGPFTAVQLKEMGLKPYDLLWTEGKGAAWQYASEIPELKSFAPVIEEQPFDRFYKRKEAVAMEQQQTTTVKKTKPRYRISNGQLIMVEAGNMEVSASAVVKEAPQIKVQKEPVVTEKIATASNWQDMYSEWQQPTAKKEAKAEEPVAVETKYSESLDDLKKRYAEKVLHEKGEKTSSLSSASVKQNITAAIALIVLVVGGYIGYTLKQKDSAKVEGKSAVERADLAGGNSLTDQPLTDENTANTQVTNDNTSSEQKIDRSNESSLPATKPQATNKATAVNVVKNNIDPKASANGNIVKKENSTTDKNAAVNTKNTNTAKTNNNAETGKPASKSATSTPVTTQPDNTASSPVASAPVIKAPAKKSINDYVAVKKIGGSGNSVQNVRLLVNNVTDFPIDLAVIDIQYFDSKGKYQKGETMYVKNIDGGNNVEIRVPDSERSSSIKYKVSLVSSEQKTLYLVAD